MNAQEIIQTEFNALRTDIINRMTSAGQMATGRTARKFTVENVSDSHGELWGAMWTFSLEKGRGPAKGKGNSSGDFVANLKLWIVAKGIQVKDEKDLDRLAKFFAWYINKFGTGLFRRGGRTDIYTPAIDQFMKNIKEKLFVGFQNEFVRTI